MAMRKTPALAQEMAPLGFTARHHQDPQGEIIPVACAKGNTTLGWRVVFFSRFAVSYHGEKPSARFLYDYKRATRRCRPKVTRIGTQGVLDSRRAVLWQMQIRA